MKNVRPISAALTALMAVVCFAWMPPSVQAQRPLPQQRPGEPTGAKPGLLSKIGIDQRLNHQVPLDLPFVDETGRPVTLGDYFGKRPVLLALVYYECPMLCTQVLNGVTGALKVLNFDVGREFDVVAVSINPKEGPGLASQKKQAYVERYGRPHTAAGWHFLTGEEENIQELAAAVGFRYAYDEEIKQYAHGAGVELLTPKGVIARYFYGIEYAPRDIRLGIVEASEERIGSVIDSALLLCYHYDPSTGKYGATALGLVRIGAVATVAAFGTFLFVSIRRERSAAGTERERVKAARRAAGGPADQDRP
ncbi:MAG: SCO family protein [Acidobacteria bacterium]|nr:SCO family protein [Acidobacteriota bacterium]